MAAATDAGGQLKALLAIRWQMVRNARVRRGLLLLALSLPLLVVTGGSAGQVVRDSNLSFNILLLTPTLFLGFAALTVAAPLTSGGGNELFPPEQLVAFPIRPGTTFLASLASAPLNLAWATQVVALAAATSFVADRGPLVVLALITTFVYVLLATTAGQVVGWFVAGLRQAPLGRVLTRLTGGILALGLLVVLQTGHGVDLLDQSPTTFVVIAAVQGSQGTFAPWGAATAVLALIALGALRLGPRTAAWALRQPTDNPRAVVSRRVRRRRLPGRPFAVLLRTDRASVWRSTPLRRGLIVLAVLPGLVASLAHTPWSSLPLLPGLVAAGAGLLFGVNAFCLDGSGGTWLASLPHSGRVSAVAKVLVTAETCLAAVAVTVLLGALRAPDVPSAADLTALLGSCVASLVVVAATCLRLSVDRPHQADLRGPRDAPAPPASMAVYSLRLALSTTTLGSLFVGAAESGVAIAGVVLAALYVAWAARSLRRTLRKFDRPEVRSRVVTVVASG